MKVYFFRHGQAEYHTSKRILAENPEHGIDYENQIYPDATEAGLRKAKKIASRFFARFDSKLHEIHLWSSKEARALTYINVFREHALDLGFDIVKPQHTNLLLSDKISKSSVQTLNELSPNYHNLLWETALFTSEKQMVFPINWDTVNSHTRKQWDIARKIITRHDRGSKDKNAFYHTNAVLRFYQDLLSPYDLHKRQFKDLVRKIRNTPKMLRNRKKEPVIIALGHKNYLAYCLDKLFGGFEIGYLECLTFRVNGHSVFVSKNNAERKIIFT